MSEPAGLDEVLAAGWRLAADGKSISKSFKFKDFVSAFSFMSGAALVAERMDHHPDWSNVYNRVEVSLSTHDAGGLTDRDIKLAKAMDQLGA